MEFKVATTAAEREAAFRLVHRRYVRSQLDEENPYSMRVTPYHLLDTTTVFVAKLRGDVVATLSLVEDGELGLPMEAMYRRQVDERRQMGVRVGEVICLADRREDIRRFVDVFRSLTRLLAQYARRHGVDELLAAVHPRHAPFYQKVVGFQTLAGLAKCPHVKDNPSVGLFLSFPQCDALRPQWYNDIFGQPLDERELQCPLMSSEERLFLEQVCYGSPQVVNGLAAC